MNWKIKKWNILTLLTVGKRVFNGVFTKEFKWIFGLSYVTTNKEVVEIERKRLIQEKKNKRPYDDLLNGKVNNFCSLTFLTLAKNINKLELLYE